MVGIYDYTVILTYMSVASAISGIGFAFNDRPFLAILCLMLSGLFDMYDGKVARTKKRDQQAINFGIQIDSLADILAFGVLPVAIGYSIGMNTWYYLPIGVIFVLAALIRLAHFNVLEEEIAKTKEGRSTSFIGLPTTSVALILPVVFAARGWCGIYFPAIYAASLLVIAVLFVLKLRFVNKPDTKRMIMMIFLGLLEIIMIMVLFKLWKATR